ncbi:DUF4149 domain-containing protein [Polynucleobacter sp. MWH-UH25E]|uniref:DUF4149 domain-containing protein n=1 Tax=Polynucleobacter sp. MWH-UH25E TaxID=1855616 RepID=UPI001BFD6621|nr:DUF4149 domain-containing protein [Polynucleobacter sp. MWH-UH25E]QWD61714.1 DUF4149 domain-containing protein [Polynucleobacter sp. MWH-UH25E]
MSHTKIQRLFTVISGLWVGGFITIGFLVVPILFATIGDRQIAGVIAAHLFKISSYIGVGVCSLLMLIANRLVKLGNRSYRLIRWTLLLMLICTVVAAFIIIPWMNALRDQALQLGISVRDTSSASLFGLLHRVSSVIFIIQSILGIALVWWSTKNVD